MKLIKSFSYAWKGFQTAVREERNMKIHLAAAAAVAGLAFYVRVTAVEAVLLMLLVGLVIGMELINSAIENLTNLVSPQQHPLAGKVKDISAAAVLFVSCVSALAGITIFAKYFF